MKIFDCFKFFNELELLELRLMELDDTVDHFILVEASATHTGKPKDFIFEGNKHLFSRYLHKIIHIKVTELPHYSTDDIWTAENYQRNAIMVGLNACAKPGDKVIISDVDEIPIVEVIRANLSTPHWVTFRKKLFYYYVNCQQNCLWDGSIMAEFGTFASPQQLRYAARGSAYDPQPNGGWHYSFMGGAERVRTKVESIAESHLIIDKVGDVGEIDRKMRSQSDLWGRTETYAQKFLVDITNDAPRCIRQFIRKYPHFYFDPATDSIGTPIPPTEKTGRSLSDSAQSS